MTLTEQIRRMVRDDPRCSRDLAEEIYEDAGRVEANTVSNALHILWRRKELARERRGRYFYYWKAAHHHGNNGHGHAPTATADTADALRQEIASLEQALEVERLKSRKAHLEEMIAKEKGSRS